MAKHDHFNDFQRALCAGAMTSNASAAAQTHAAAYGLEHVAELLVQHEHEHDRGAVDVILAGALVFIARAADRHKISLRDVAMSAVTAAKLPNEIDFDVMNKITIMSDSDPSQYTPYDVRKANLPVRKLQQDKRWDVDEIKDRIAATQAAFPPVMTEAELQAALDRGREQLTNRLHDPTTHEGTND